MSIINVNKISTVGGGNTITVAAGIASYTGKINCPEFDNNPSFTGNVTIAGNLGVAGTITYEDVDRVDATGISTFREGFGVGPLTGIALTAYKDGSIRTTGIITATSFSGTASTATNSAKAYALDSAANITTGIVTATAFVPSAGQLSHRNLIINGDMRVAQRGTTSTTSGYHSIDRWKCFYQNTDEAPTQHQVDVSSNDPGPFEEGFRKAFRITNGNQTSGAGAGDRITLSTALEAQDICTSGWNYLSSSSYITLSFWVKSTVTQNFYGYLITNDGTARLYPFETGSMTANTWYKITKTIPGNTNLTVDNNNGSGLEIELTPFMGTNYTASGVTLNQWNAAGSWNDRTPDQTSTWYTTNDAQFELTGVQLEVGSVATPFEHRSYGDELLRCYRYFYKAPGYNSHAMFSRSSTAVGATVNTPVPMRTAPASGTTNWVRVQRPGVDYGDSSAGSWTVGGAAPTVTLTGSSVFFQYGSMSNVTNTANTVYGFLTYDLELEAEL